MSTRTLRGQCFCGAVGFELITPTDFCSHCHCSSCRRLSGAAFVTWTSAPEERFKFVRGEANVKWFASSTSVQWGSCRDCSSTLLYRTTDSARVYVTVASLRDPLDREPSSHVSFEEHVPWFSPGDALPRHLGKSDEQLPTPATHIILFVADQEASARFYAQVLGSTPRLNVPGMTEFQLPGGAVLGLMPERGVARLFDARLSTQRAGARVELYLHVDDADAMHERALAAGATSLSEMADRDWGHRVAYSQDPDGHVLAVARL